LRLGLGDRGAQQFEIRADRRAFIERGRRDAERIIRIEQCEGLRLIGARRGGGQANLGFGLGLAT